jgi:hypothetical protein
LEDLVLCLIKVSDANEARSQKRLQEVEFSILATGFMLKLLDHYLRNPDVMWNNSNNLRAVLGSVEIYYNTGIEHQVVRGINSEA